MVANAFHAATELRNRRIMAFVVPWNTIKPLDKEYANTIVDITNKSKAIITIEEHSKIGGLGSAVAEVLAGLRQHPPLVRLGTGDCYPTTAMSYEELLRANHLDVDGIVKEVLDALH